MHKKNPKVEFYFKKDTTWKESFDALREILLETELAEDLKWGCACYTLEGTNVVLIHGFKEYCALLFFKGAVMKDPKSILIQQTASVQAARQIRFTGVKDVLKLKPAIKAYIQEAIRVEKAGLKVEMKKNPEPVPEELQVKLDTNSALEEAFYALTPGRQRAYILYFSGAKQATTRAARVEKCTPQILDGKGLDD